MRGTRPSIGERALTMMLASLLVCSSLPTPALAEAFSEFEGETAIEEELGEVEASDETPEDETVQETPLETEESVEPVATEQDDVIVTETPEDSVDEVEYAEEAPDDELAAIDASEEVLADEPTVVEAESPVLTSAAESGTRQAFLDVVTGEPVAQYRFSKDEDDNEVKYNNYNGLAWCGYFVEWCARQAGVSEEVIPDANTCKLIPTFANWFKDRGLYVDKYSYVPQAGDICFMYGDGVANGHVGVVVRTSGDTIWVKEGNVGRLDGGEGGSADEVQENEMDKTGSRITGFGTPLFPDAPDFNYGPNVTFAEGDGVYTIASVLDRGLFVEVEGGSTEDGANVRLWTDDSEDQRRWKFTHNSDGTYTITNVKSGKALDVSAGSTSESANVQQWSSAGVDQQHWYVQDCGNGFYAFKAKHSGYFLDVAGGEAKTGTNLQQYHGFTDNRAQMFIISKSFGKSGELPFGDGEYEISSVLNRDLAITVEGASTENAANVMLSSWTSAANQRFTFTHNDDGTYSIAAVHSGKVLDVTGYAMADGTNIQQWNNADADQQHWFVQQVEGKPGTYALKCKYTGKYLDVKSASAVEGANIQQWHGNLSDAQCFHITPYYNYGDPVEVQNGSSYYLRPYVDPAYAVDVDVSNGVQDGANVRLWTWTGADTQRVKFLSNSNGTYNLSAGDKTHYLDIKQVSYADRANVHIWSASLAAPSRRWYAYDAGWGGTIALRNMSSGLFLHVDNGVGADGTNIDQAVGGGATSQRFYMTPTRTGTVANVPDGSYRLKMVTGQFVSVGEDGSLSIDDNGSAITTTTEDGHVTLTAGGSVLSVARRDLIRGTSAQFDEGSWTEGTCWQIEDAGNGLYNLRNEWSNLYLGLVDGKVVQTEWNDGKAFALQLIPADETLPDGWHTFPDGAKGYVKNGALVKGWLDLNGGKYWFDDQGRMATGWTDLVIDGKTMHYYFRPSGNLARGSWADIDGKKYWFRASGNMATGWADIDGKKYWFDESGQMVTGWRDIDNGQGSTNHYYFRPSGSMATGWAQIDGASYYFRPSGNMATGFTDVTDDAYKRYFDESGRMLTGWQEINGNTYYFRSSGAMQTGTATIDGMACTFTDKGVLVLDGASLVEAPETESELFAAEPDAMTESEPDMEELVSGADSAPNDEDNTELGVQEVDEEEMSTVVDEEG